MHQGKMESLRILHLEDNEFDRALVKKHLKEQGFDFEITYSDSREDFETRLDGARFDLIISDYTLPSYDGMAALKAAMASQPNVPFIFVSGTIGEERAVESLKAGATDYVLKENPRRLGPAIQRALHRARARQQCASLPGQSGRALPHIFNQSTREQTPGNANPALPLTVSQRLEWLGTLAAGAAHDLNNVLAPILASAELLREEEENPDRLNLLAIIQASAERGVALIRQVLAFAPGGEGRKVMVDLRRLGCELENTIRQTFPKRIIFEYSASSDLRLVPGDPTQLFQVLLNLLVNARDAMPLSGKLKFTLENVAIQYGTPDFAHSSLEPGDYVRIRISDTGSGIPPEIKDRIFEPFFTTKKAQGNGLGLTTALRIVTAHGGVIRLNSSSETGTEFTVYLPAA